MDDRSGHRVRVLVADDDARIRRAVARLLDSTGDFEVVGQAEDGAVAVARTRELTPEVIVMDLRMPVMDGIEATRQIHAEFSAVSIIGVSAVEEPDRVAAMRDAGAVAVLWKNDPEQLMELLRACVRPRHGAA